MSLLSGVIYSIKDFQMDFTLNGNKTEAYEYQTVTIPGIGDPTTQDVVTDQRNEKIITAPGTYNDFTFATLATKDIFDWTKAAISGYSYIAELTGKDGREVAGEKWTISGQVSSPGDLQIGADGVPQAVFNGTTKYLNVQ